MGKDNPIPKSTGTFKRRRSVSNRRCFEGILWVLRSGVRWNDLLQIESKLNVSCKD